MSAVPFRFDKTCRREKPDDLKTRTALAADMAFPAVGPFQV